MNRSLLFRFKTVVLGMVLFGGPGIAFADTLDQLIAQSTVTPSPAPAPATAATPAGAAVGTPAGQIQMRCAGPSTSGLFSLTLKKGCPGGGVNDCYTLNKGDANTCPFYEEKSGEAFQKCMDARALCQSREMGNPDCKDSFKEYRDATKDLRKARTDLRKEGRDEAKEIAKMNEDLTQIGLDRDEKLNRIKDDAEQVQRDAMETIDRIKEKLEDKQKQIAESILRLEAQIDEGEAKKRDLAISKAQAKNAHLDAISRLDAQCHSLALTQVQKLREQTLKSMENSTYSTGGFNSVMTSVGHNNKQRSKILAEGFFKDCREDRSYKDSVASAVRARDMAIQMADAQIGDISKVQDKIRAQIVSLQTKEQQTALSRSLKDMEHVQTQMNAKLDKLNRDAQNETNSASTKTRSKQTQIWQRQRDLAADRGDSSFAAVVPGMQNYVTSGQKIDSKVLDEYPAVEEAADAAVSACCMSMTGDESDTKWPDYKSCKAACQALDSEMRSESCQFSDLKDSSSIPGVIKKKGDAGD